MRIGHGIVVFPGGVGTAEEILYLLGILLREENRSLPFPLVLTGPVAAAPYFEQIDRFIRLTLGEDAASRYEIVIGEPDVVARRMAAGIAGVREHRIAHKDSFFFNWALDVPLASSSRSCRPTRPWPRSTFTTAASRTSWRPTCAAPFPASSPATSGGRCSGRVARPFRSLARDMSSLDALLRAFVA